MLPTIAKRTAQSAGAAASSHRVVSACLRAAPVAAGAWAPAAAASTTSGGKLVSQSKAKRLRDAEAIHFKGKSVNDPATMTSNLRYVAYHAKKSGVANAVAEFDAAAAAFSVKTPLVAATLLERGPVIIRDPEVWEAEWLEFQEMVRERHARQYPVDFIERQTQLSAAELAASGMVSAEAAGARSGKGAAGDVEDVATGASQGGTFGQFHLPTEATEEEQAEAALADFEPQPRVTQADELNDQRSLQRRLQDRLVLLVQRRSDGQWALPQTVRKDSESMVQAAERGLRGAFGEQLDAWYPGNAPMGHWLQVNSKDVQKSSGQYGSKIFFYRAILCAGKLNLGSEYADHRWVHRTELEAYLPPSDFTKYLYQVLGA